MKTNRFTFVLLAILFTFSTVQAKSKILLRLNVQKGSTYEMNLTSSSNIDQEMMGQQMKIDQKMDMTFSYLVTDVLPNKNFQIEYSIMQMKMDMNINGQTMSFDSQKPDENSPMSSVLKSLNSVKVRFEMTPTGHVENVQGLDEFAKQISGNRQVAQTMQMFSNQENFASFVGQNFIYFPENEIKKGDKWTALFKLPALMNLSTTMNFEATEITKSAVNLNVTSEVNMESPIEQSGMKMDMKMTGTQTGTMIVDSKDGWMRTSDLNQKFDMHIKMKNPQSGEDMEIPMTVNSITKIVVNKK